MIHELEVNIHYQAVQGKHSRLKCRHGRLRGTVRWRYAWPNWGARQAMMKGVPGNLDHVADTTWAMFDRYIIRYIIHKWSFRMLKYQRASSLRICQKRFSRRLAGLGVKLDRVSLATGFIWRLAGCGRAFWGKKSSFFHGGWRWCFRCGLLVDSESQLRSSILYLSFLSVYQHRTFGSCNSPMLQQLELTASSLLLE